MVGRPVSTALRTLGFEMVKDFSHGRRKYRAKCGNCGRELANTCGARLQIHRNNCGYNSLDKETKIAEVLDNAPNKQRSSCELLVDEEHPNTEFEFVMVDQEEPPNKKICTSSVLPLADEIQITQAMVNFFLGCNIPSNVINSNYFKDFIKVLRPNFLEKIPSQEVLLKKMSIRKKSICSIIPCSSFSAVMLVDGRNKSTDTKTVVTMLHNPSNDYLTFVHSADLSTKSNAEENFCGVVENSLEQAKNRHNADIYCIVSDKISNTCLKESDKLKHLWFSCCNSYTADQLVKDISSLSPVSLCLEKTHYILGQFKSLGLEKTIVDKGGYNLEISNDTRWCSNKYVLCCLKFNLPFMKEITGPIKMEEDIKLLLLDEAFELQIEECINLLDPLYQLINTAQSADCSLAEMVDMWLEIENNEIYQKESYQELINKYRDSILTKYALATYYFHIEKDINKLTNEQLEQICNFLINELNKEGLEHWVDFRESRNMFKTLGDKKITDPIVFWKTAKLKYAELSDLALKLLQIPASSAHLE